MHRSKWFKCMHRILYGVQQYTCSNTLLAAGTMGAKCYRTRATGDREQLNRIVRDEKHEKNKNTSTEKCVGRCCTSSLVCNRVLFELNFTAAVTVLRLLWWCLGSM